jgi:2-amino-4-hydroxy-6-hydroxymethyldihydropteridine diphosphokinase
MSEGKSSRAFIGVGSNLNDPLQQVNNAIALLHELKDTRFLAASRLYCSRPLGPADQPDYVNAVVAVDTHLPPLALLDELQALETRQGRARTGQRWGPRVIDLDLLLYGEQTIATARLIVPHPGLHQRSFVLYPLYDIDPGLNIPGQGPLAELVARCKADDLEPLTSA